MIGNDVVDLGDADCLPAACHPRFDARVFSPRERGLLEGDAHPERMRWILWAAKESAYKVARRLDPRTVFSPSRFVVEPQGAGRATVHVGPQRFAVRFVATRNHVHAVARAVGTSDRRTCGAVARMGDDWPDRRPDAPSVAVRRLALATVARALNVSREDLTIGSDSRIPTLYLLSRRIPITLSLSHHGRFVAFACALPSA